MAKRGNPNLGKKEQDITELNQNENIINNTNTDTEIDDSLENNENIKNIPEETIQEVKTIKPSPKSELKPIWQPDLHRMICVKNISRGKLVYKSKRQMGYITEWEKTDDENYIELLELVNLKNTDKRFITEPWIRISEDDEIEILQYLGIYKYYEKILDIENIENVIQLSPDKFEKKFKVLPASFKEAIAERAANMIKTGELDSLKIKNIIEKEMDIDLNMYGRG